MQNDKLLSKKEIEKPWLTDDCKTMQNHRGVWESQILLLHSDLAMNHKFWPYLKYHGTWSWHRTCPCSCHWSRQIWSFAASQGNVPWIWMLAAIWSHVSCAYSLKWARLFLLLPLFVFCLTLFFLQPRFFAANEIHYKPTFKILHKTLPSWGLPSHWGYSGVEELHELLKPLLPEGVATWLKAGWRCGTVPPVFVGTWGSFSNSTWDRLHQLLSTYTPALYHTLSLLHLSYINL